ncbi:lysine--tRNA ligase [Candidatus Peregrinibacteria bacterium]|nr:MAG: lysine--tRNA ligase [Candidatus Peregrinibacteria bacterium]
MPSQEYNDRLRKADELRKLGINPYPARYEGSHSIAEVLASKKAQKTRSIEDILADKISTDFTIRGRLMTLREHGRLAFANLKDATGTIQICFMEQVLGKENYKLLRKVDMGDFIGASGELFMTKHGQLTLLIKDWTFLGKTLRPLPEKWHGLQDQEAKYRQRYLDLVMSEETTSRFVFRSRFIEEIRQFLNLHSFLEVETPVLAAIASGATARPFLTHHNALDLDVHLRIAPELYLKRLIAGGMERVYEFAKCFRNEGMDPSHLQEFTMLEYYGAYWNYEDNMNFTEKMLTTVIKKLFGTTKIKVRSRDGSDVEVDFKAPWPRISFGELIEKDSGIKIYDFLTPEHPEGDVVALRAAIKKARDPQGQKIILEDAEKMGYGNLCDALYKKVSRPKLINPCFVIDHPASTMPLARRSDENPKVCETFQLLVNTWEVVKAYSELVDPVDQRERFIEQAKAAAGGDEEAMDMDLDYLTAMEHGMPPISGFGMGIDRIVTLLTGQDNLRDAVLFPIMRPLEEDLKAAKKIAEKARESAKKGHRKS